LTCPIPKLMVGIEVEKTVVSGANLC